MYAGAGAGGNGSFGDLEFFLNEYEWPSAPPIPKNHNNHSNENEEFFHKLSFDTSIPPLSAEPNNLFDLNFAHDDETAFFGVLEDIDSDVYKLPPPMEGIHTSITAPMPPLVVKNEYPTPSEPAAPSAARKRDRMNMALQGTLEVDDESSDDMDVEQEEEQAQIGDKTLSRYTSEGSRKLVKFMEIAQQRFEETKGKQTCHFCGRHRKEEERKYCQNPHCFLQGAKRKYMCHSCIHSQKVYFGDQVFLNIFGDVESDEWYCPCCIVWEDDFLPYPGICCCSFRRHDMSCPWHEDCGDAKKNPHCKPYRQKNTKEDRMICLPMSSGRIQIGSRPFFRKMIHSGKKVHFNTNAKKTQKKQKKDTTVTEEEEKEEEKKKREVVEASLREFSRYTSSTHWLGLMLKKFGYANRFVQTPSMIRSYSQLLRKKQSIPSVGPRTVSQLSSKNDLPVSGNRICVDGIHTPSPLHTPSVTEAPKRKSRGKKSTTFAAVPPTERKSGPRTRSQTMKLRTKTL